MLSTNDRRDDFIQNSIKFLRNWKFDGLDLWFEHNYNDKKRYTELLQVINPS